MFKTISKVILVLIICLGMGKIFYQMECYSLDNCKVIQKNDGIVTIEDTRGHYWDYCMIDTDKEFKVYKGLNAGDRVKVKWFTNHTDSCIEDDIIVRIAK